MPVVDGNDGDVIHALCENGVAVFEVARQVVQRAGGSKSAGYGEKNHRLAAKKRIGGGFHRAIGGLFLEGCGRQFFADLDSHVHAPMAVWFARL
ncbi:hypothetical protein D3C87_1843300 [compost metagenome]